MSVIYSYNEGVMGLNEITHDGKVNRCVAEYAKNHTRKETLGYNNNLYFGVCNPKNVHKDQYNTNRQFILDFFKSDIQKSNACKNALQKTTLYKGKYYRTYGNPRIEGEMMLYVYDVPGADEDDNMKFIGSYKSNKVEEEAENMGLIKMPMYMKSYMDNSVQNN